MAKVKGLFVLASEVEPYKTLQADRVNDVVRKMGASATITLPLAPGSALLLRLDEIQWEFGYEDSAVGTRPGLSVDISWALLEAPDDPVHVATCSPSPEPLRTPGGGVSRRRGARLARGRT